jgi:hypothetical protein
MAKVYADMIEVLDALEEKGLEVASWQEMQVERQTERGRGKPSQKVSAFISPNILIGALERYARHVDEEKKALVQKTIERLQTGSSTRTRTTGPTAYGDVRELKVSWKPKNPKQKDGPKRPYLMIPLDLYTDDLALEEPKSDKQPAPGTRIRLQALQSLTIRYDKKQIVIDTERANAVGENDDDEDDEAAAAQ